jgi:pimeloyl-ACP methyl ester carboxylesterase
VIALIHGLGVGPRYLLPLASELDGAGQMFEKREPLPIPELATSFAASFAGPAIVVAHSMGCQVAAELAFRWSELVEALVLVGPTVDPRARSVVRHVGRLAVDAWYEPPRLTAVVARDYLATGPADVLRQARHALAHRIEELLPRIEQPAVVVRGAHDRICPAEWAGAVAALLPHGRLATIAGAAHAAHFSHPREVAQLVMELSGTPAAAG